MNEFDLDFKAFLRRHGDLSWKTTATLCRLGRPTRNGHIYPRELMEREIERLARSPLLGAIHHGPGPATGLDLTNVAFAIEHMRIEGDEVKGDLKLLNTRQGAILRTLMENGSRISFSTTGMGRTDENGVVQDDFQMLGVVALPPEP